LMNEAVNASPDDLSLRYARSIAATELDELTVAEKDLLFVLEREPNDANALNALGYTLASKTFRFKEARQYLSQAISLRPNDSAILDSMGWLNYREGHYEKALVLLQEAYKISPEGEVAAHLGETLWMLGRQKEARQLWEDALKRDADNRHLIEVLKRLK
jgi:Flp pilus assembly protein TadD